MEVLLVLVQSAGKRVTKDVLMKRVWGATAVEPNNVDQAISSLRRAFGETPGDNKYIETLARDGYRFVGPVKTMDRIENAEPVEIVAPVEVVAPVVTVAPVEQGQANVIAPAEIVATIEQVPNKVSEGNENARPGVYDKDGNLVIGAAEYEAMMKEAEHYPKISFETSLDGGLGSQAGKLSDEALDREMDEAAFAADKEEQKLRDRLEEIDAEDDGRNDHDNFHYDPDDVM